MDIVNAISKVRFASTGPQQVHLARNDAYRVDILCMEAGQKSRAQAGPCAYYVIVGSAKLTAGGSASADEYPLPAGQMASIGPNEAHTVANTGEGRLICLVIQASG